LYGYCRKTEGLKKMETLDYKPDSFLNSGADLKERVLNWLSTLHPDEEAVWVYRLNQTADPSVFASCFAVFLRHLFDDLQTLSEGERAAWLSWLQGFQDPETGLFMDPENVNRATDPLHDTEHLNRQLSTFCLSAIDALGGKPHHRLRFLEPWKDSDRLTHWLESLDWYNPWNCGNKVMFMGIFFAYDAHYNGDATSLEALDIWFDWHDQNQSSKTGFWGNGRKAAYIDGMGGAYHQYVVYNYQERIIRYADRIVDKVLFLQQPDGMYSIYKGGASCYELDAVDILVHLYERHDYRRGEIEQALRRVLTGVLANQNPDGGFCWAQLPAWGIKDFWRLGTDIFRHKSIYYWYLCWRSAIRIQTVRQPEISTGWSRQGRRWSDSSIFDTWFRCLTIAEISQVLPDLPYAELEWQFLKVPGLGWFPK
jgi:hypothetical protein